jgi:molybdopterin-guanine dinucleotide biosynthesis protein A
MIQQPMPPLPPPPPLDLRRVTLAVLAGGAGSRMGRPKALLRVDGRPILADLFDRFAWPGPTLLVTAPGRERPPGADRFGREVADPQAGLGPLRGVLTALEQFQTPLLVVTALDMPGVGRTQVEWLAEQLHDASQLQGLMTERMIATGPQREPLPLALRAEAKSVVAGHLAAGRRSLRGLASEATFAVVPAPPWPESVWSNLNTPADGESFAAGGRRISMDGPGGG